MEILTNERRYDLDWIRVIAFGFLILYHVGMFFVPWGWHIKNNQIYDWLTYPMMFVNQWRLSLLFVVSGMGTYFALSKRTGGQFAKERLIRLLLPLAFGMLVIVPPQVYFERLDKGQFTGDYLSYWFSEAFTGVYPQGNLSWHHLWFLVYLLFFSLIFIPVFLYLRKHPENALLRFIKKLASSPYGIYLLVLPLYIFESLVEPFFKSTHAFIGDWFNLLHYGTLFFYGFLLIAVRQTFWQTILNQRFKLLVFGLISFSIFMFIKIQIKTGVWEDDYLVHFTEAFFKVINLWSWILIIFGFAAYYLNKPSSTLTYCNEAVYPFYILHQTITVTLGYYLKNASMGLFLKFSLMSLGTFLIAWILYELLIRRIGFIRPFFGLKPAKSNPVMQKV
ncbi:MAG: acyltransferase family protein [Raineya sp.]|jgi:peptidoglycan/LPS O-acetylase OafA/YrhL|nr:acyltransferase family protein [Raineya sp.]